MMYNCTVSVCIYSSIKIIRPVLCIIVIYNALYNIMLLQINSTEQTLGDITSAVVKELTESCAKCGISSDIIDRQSFACFPESPTHVTFRARLEGSSERSSSFFIFLLESWVSGGATINVTGVLMTVDAECSVAISSLSEGECSTTSSTDNRVVIIGGAVLAVLFIIAVSVVVGVALILKCRRVERPVRKANE